MVTFVSMIKSLLVALTLILLGTNAIAQNTFSIRGLVRDQKDGLPGASIYLSGYKIATVADNDGRFKRIGT